MYPSANRHPMRPGAIRSRVVNNKILLRRFIRAEFGGPNVKLFPVELPAVQFQSSSGNKTTGSVATVRHVGMFTFFSLTQSVIPVAFLAAAVWGGQWSGHICIWGGIPNDIMYDWVRDVIWHHLYDVMLWIRLICYLAILQPVSLGRGHRGPELWQGDVALAIRTATVWHCWLLKARRTSVDAAATCNSSTPTHRPLMWSIIQIP